MPKNPGDWDSDATPMERLALTGVCILFGIILAGCATSGRSGFEKYADYKECEAQDRPYRECTHLMDKAFAQVARDADDGYDIPAPTLIIIR